jgi:YVTN family beta-propeller protein
MTMPRHMMWVLALALGAATRAEAAPASTPAADSWPCEIVPKDTLRAAEIWAPAGTAAAQGWQSDPAIARLVGDVAPRSVDLVDAGMRLARFAESSATPDATRARLAAGLIATIDMERRTIIGGIRRFNGRQALLARRIEQGYATSNASAPNASTSNASPEPGAAVAEQILWDTRIFEDRQRMLPLVCRQPAALEARLAALVAALRAPSDIAKGQAGPYLVYATNEGSGDVSIVDPAERREVARIAIGKRPRGLVASPDGSLLYVAVSGSPAAGPGVDESKLPPPDKAADGIVVIDLASRQVLRTLRGISDPEQIAISPDGRRLYVASEDSGQLIVIGTDGSMLGALAVGGEPEGVTVSADSATILSTSEGDNSLAIVSGEPLKVVGRVTVGERPRNALFLDPKRVAVPGEFDSSISIVDLASRKRVRTITLAKDDRPMGAARLDPHTMLLTTGRGGRLLRVDVDAADTITGAAKVGPRPWGLALAPDAALAFTANGSSDDISIVDPRTMSVVAKVAVGTGPWGVIAVRTPAPHG